MSSHDWLEKKKRRGQRTTVLVVALALLIMTVIIRNNPSLLQRLRFSGIGLWSTKSKNTTAETTLPESTVNDADAHGPVDRVDDTLTAPPETSTVMLTDIPCTVMDRSDVYVYCTIALPVTDPLFHRELLVKRKELRVMVQKSLHELPLSEVKTATLTNRITEEMNAILDRGRLSRVDLVTMRIATRG